MNNCFHVELTHEMCPMKMFYSALLPGLNENFEISSEWNTDDGFRSKELAANPNASPRPVAGE